MRKTKIYRWHKPNKEKNEKKKSVYVNCSDFILEFHIGEKNSIILDQMEHIYGICVNK